MATFEEFMKVAEISIKDKTSHKRMNEIVRIMRQYKVLHGLTPEQAVEVLQALGPTYVKIGQLASNRSDLLPKAYCDAFEKLRDDANPMPFDVVIEQIDRAYGKSWHEVFASIDPVPLGAASIAQVHKATLLDGTTVAVKVRRPGVAESMAEDIMLMKHLLALGEFASNSHRSILLSLEGFVEEIERTTASEVNFTSELHNLMRFHDELADEQGVTSPVAYPQYSCESVLVMEFVQGTEISHTEELCQQGVDMNALARRVCQSYVTQVLDDGFFHADPHPGNILVRDGDVVWIDLGMVGTLTVSERMLVGKVFTAVATDNAYLLKEAVMGLVHVLGPVDHGALLEALSRLLAEYSTAEMKEINVNTFCEATMDKVKELVQPEVSTVVNAAKLQIKTNPEQLERILIHLLKNAAEYTESGKIFLDFKKRGAHTHQFIISDTGTGIPAEKQENLFKPFTEIKDLTEGDGLGLPICALIATKMNGSLTLDTSYTKGSRFVLELHT